MSVSLDKGAFNVALAAGLFLSDRATFDALVAPSLTPEQVEEVSTYANQKAAREASDKGRETLKRQMLPESRDDDMVAALYDGIADVAALMVGSVAHKAPEQEGGWGGRTVRSIPVVGGTVKVIYTDAKPPRK